MWPRLWIGSSKRWQLKRGYEGGPQATTTSVPTKRENWDTDAQSKGRVRTHGEGGRPRARGRGRRGTRPRRPLKLRLPDSRIVTKQTPVIWATYGTSLGQPRKPPGGPPECEVSEGNCQHWVSRNQRGSLSLFVWNCHEGDKLVPIKDTKPERGHQPIAGHSLQ